MRSSTPAEKARKAVVQKRRKLVLEESRLARLKKKARSAETHDKFLLGNMTILAGWGNLELHDAEKRIALLPPILTNENEFPCLKKTGEELFRSATEIESDLHRLSEDEKRSAIHYRITLGGEIIRQGLGLENRAVLLGAMHRLRRN